MTDRALACFCLLVIGGCKHEVPTPSAEDPADTQAEIRPALDVLLVIDGGASMCQEQTSFSAATGAFLSTLEGRNVDYRVAVVTTDMLTPEVAGRFQLRKTTEFPFACSQTVIRYCLRGADEMCAEGYDSPAFGSEPPLGEGWVCDAPPDAEDITNCNGSLNSGCRRLCEADWQCDAAHAGVEQGTACKNDEDACRYDCLMPSRDPKNSGCALRPPTRACPDATSLAGMLGDAPWVTPGNAEEVLPCITVVGAHQHNNAGLAQGFNAAIAALAPDGPNAAQAAAFRRDEAHLLVVFLSDTDDCSTDAGVELKKELYGTCECLGDSLEGGELRPVSDAVSRIRALGSDPSHVWVAAISGDSLKTETDAITADRDAFVDSKCASCPNLDPHPLRFNTYMCASDDGKANYGRRYIDLVGAFGENGMFWNICRDAGVGLEAIAEWAAEAATRPPSSSRPRT